MLHAIEKNKSKLYERYWGLQDLSVRGNITAEDEITSTLFGPLEFMTPLDVWFIAEKILGEDKLPTESPTKFELNFWRTLENGKEPDAELIFYANNNPILAILFELKWGASEGVDKEGKYQLDTQWEAFRKLHRCDAYHLFIAKESAVKKVEEAINKGRENIWGGKLTCRSWDGVRGILDKVVKEDGYAVYRWACLVNNFLQLATATQPFGGFGMSAEEVPEGFGAYPEIDFSKLTHRPLFWDDHWFARLDKLFSADIPLYKPLFFTEENHD